MDPIKLTCQDLQAIHNALAAYAEQWIDNDDEEQARVYERLMKKLEPAEQGIVF